MRLNHRHYSPIEVHLLICDLLTHNSPQGLTSVDVMRLDHEDPNSVSHPSIPID